MDADAQEGAATGTGFAFDDFSERGLIKAIERVTSSYKHYRRWRPLMINAMAQDFSWDESAKKYEQIYIETLYEPDDHDAQELDAPQ